MGIFIDGKSGRRRLMPVRAQNYLRRILSLFHRESIGIGKRTERWYGHIRQLIFLISQLAKCTVGSCDINEIVAEVKIHGLCPSLCQKQSLHPESVILFRNFINSIGAVPLRQSCQLSRCRSL